MKLHHIVKQHLKKIVLGKPIKVSLLELNRKSLFPSDKILLSHPRSGNTWTRHLIADLILQHLGFETATELPINHTSIIPTIYSQNIANSVDNRIHLPYRLMKSHHHQDGKGRHFIYVFRQPGDVLCSYYRFIMAKQNPKQESKFLPVCFNLDMSIDEFCLRNINGWKKHVFQALNRHEQDPQNVVWVCYEQLHENPIPTLNHLIEFLGLDRQSINLEKTIENHSFKNRLSVLLKAGKQSERAFSTRKGKIGSSSEELRPETQKIIYDRTHTLYDRALYLCLKNSAFNDKHHSFAQISG